MHLIHICARPPGGFCGGARGVLGKAPWGSTASGIVCIDGHPSSVLLCGWVYVPQNHTHTYTQQREGGGGRERTLLLKPLPMCCLVPGVSFFWRGLLQPAPISAQPNCPRGADVVAVSPVIPFSAEDFYALSLFCLFFCRFGGIIENRSFIKQTYVWSLGATIFT